MNAVSIIIPTFNRRDYLPVALDSVLAQTYRDYEIIVIDDGSSDDTREILAPYAERIRYFYQENRGIAGARNRGIGESRGACIALLDSDDYWLPRKLEHQIAYLKENPQWGMVATRCSSIQAHCLRRPGPVELRPHPACPRRAWQDSPAGHGWDRS